jgi:hypothetical protein
MQVICILCMAHSRICIGYHARETPFTRTEFQRAVSPNAIDGVNFIGKKRNSPRRLVVNAAPKDGPPKHEEL